MAGWIIRKLLTLDYAEVSLQRRKFRFEPRLRSGLEEVPTRFLDGYHMALATSDFNELAARIDATVPLAFQGFAYEGAGMYFALLDLLVPGGNRLSRFVETAGAHHDYIICVGAGFALARVPFGRWRPRRTAERVPARLSSLVIDGYGFHEGFFNPAKAIEGGRVPRGVDPDMRRYFDNGIGRAIWFAEGASPSQIGAAIQRFHPDRRGHLWAGLGLACAYAGMVYPDTGEYASVLQRLKVEAGRHGSDLALGTVLAAESQRKAGTVTPWMRIACDVIAGAPYERVATLGVESLRMVTDELSAGPDRDATWTMHASVSERIIESLPSLCAHALAAPPAVAELR